MKSSQCLDFLTSLKKKSKDSKYTKMSMGVIQKIHLRNWFYLKLNLSEIHLSKIYF